MATREYVIAVRDEGRIGATGNVRAIRVTMSQNEGDTRWEQFHIEQDRTHDEGVSPSFAVAANLYSASPGPLQGADWDDLAGDGVDFDMSLAGGREIQLRIYGEVPGRKTRATPRPAGAPAPVSPGATGFESAATYEVLTSGYLELQNILGGYQTTIRSVRDVVAFNPRYTTAAEVRTILRASTNRESGFEANFASRVEAAILAAEGRIDGWCGWSFHSATAAASRDFRVTSPRYIEIDPIDPARPVTITYDGDEISPDDYDLIRFGSQPMANFVRPRTNRWYPEPGKYITVEGYYGWGAVPPEVRDYAGRLSAQIFDDDAARHGLTGAGAEGMAYARKPGSDIKVALGHLRRLPVH